ncbi:FAD-dependent thymidylate synthase [Streptomyces sp. NPDC005551]|uniref:FAD-dependent thymidylate synthase n=1 Tax=Streptomyces sp. NPDC005551 TaxID=3364725 RepID=UPI0036A62CA7
MNVELIGYTLFRPPTRMRDTKMMQRLADEFGPQTASASTLSEFAGRLCYDSLNLPNEGTATNATYLANIIKQRHFSVLEHGSATFYIGGVSRSLLMEIRTHRIASFSARSTRYVDERDAQFVTPPALAPLLSEQFSESDSVTVGEELDDLMGHAAALYESIYERLIANGATRKEAREAAREFLPGATETEFVMTANHHAWRDLLQKRIAPGASQEIRLLGGEILRHLKELEPAIYQDIQCP